MFFLKINSTFVTFGYQFHLKAFYLKVLCESYRFKGVSLFDDLTRWKWNGAIFEETEVNTWKWRIRFDSDERIIVRDILSQASEGDCVTERLLWWCYQGQLHGAEPRVGALKEPRGSQLPADPPLCRDPPASHVHFAPKSLKGIPWVHFCVHWPCVFDVMILCVFTALKPLSRGLVTSCFWSKCLFEVVQRTCRATVRRKSMC